MSHPTDERRNQCVECRNTHANRNMVCDACMADPGLSYGTSWSAPKNPRRATCGVKATGDRAQAMRRRMKTMKARQSAGLDPFTGRRTHQPKE